MSRSSPSKFLSLIEPLEQTAFEKVYKFALTTPRHVAPLILLSTEGGDVPLTLGWTNQAPALLPNLEIRVIGECCSAGIYFLQGASHRTSVPTAVFMSHAFTWSADLTPETAADKLASVKADQSSILDLLVDRTHNDRTFWRRWLSRERYFGAEKALELGLIDEVL